MVIKKGDILYHYDWKDISDKEYCTDEINIDKDLKCKDPDGNQCFNYKKCFVRAQNIVLQKVIFTKRTFWTIGNSKHLSHYNVQDLKYWKKQVGNFRNSGFTMSDKISPNQIDEWKKSESAALTDVIKRLKTYIRRVKKATEEDYCAFRDKRILEKLIDLQKKLTKKTKGIK